MLPSAIYDPCTHATPSQRLEAAARRERQQRFEKSARTIARVHDVVELPVDKTQRVELPITPEPPAAPEESAVDVWVDRQKRIYKTPWFSIVDEIDTQGRKKISITEIRAAICQYFGVSHLDLISARRTVAIVRPRMVGYYLAKTLTVKSLPEIGRRFGGRDHTSILSGIRKIERLRLIDADLDADIRTIVMSLGGAIA